jgi:hypothetical protein
MAIGCSKLAVTGIGILALILPKLTKKFPYLQSSI